MIALHATPRFGPRFAIGIMIVAVVLLSAWFAVRFITDETHRSLAAERPGSGGKLYSTNAGVGEQRPSWLHALLGEERLREIEEVDLLVGQ
jgi:hypothetical protein